MSDIETYEFHRINPKVDLEDTIRRIATSWNGLHELCDCGDQGACDICEIQFLLDEVLIEPEVRE